MSKEGTDFYENFTKDIYETIKGLSTDRGDFVISTYENLYGKLKTEGSSPTVNVDMNKLRRELGQIRGIGGQRLDEIMSVIERNLYGNKNASPSDNSDSPDIYDDTHNEDTDNSEQ